jgi:hypothetical protein
MALFRLRRVFPYFLDLQIIEAVTLVLAASPADQLSGALDALLGPITALLEACCSQLAPGASVKPIVPLVERFTIVLRCFQVRRRADSL